MRSECLQLIAERLGSNLDLEAVVERVADALVNEADVAACRLWLRRPGDRCHACDSGGECSDRRECLHLVASSGLEPGGDGEPTRRPIGSGLMGLLARTGAPLISNDLAADPRFLDKRWMVQAGVRSCAALPLVREGETIGILAIFSREQPISHDAEQITFFARQVAIMITHARTTDDLRRRAERLEQENRYLRREILASQPFEHMVGASAAVRRLRERIGAAAAHTAPILITGPAGAGKEFVARAIHARSPRAAEPLLKAACGELAETAVESVLFGYDESTSPCGAECRIGQLELADRGSLLIDQIDRIPLSVQQKICRTIESKRFSRIGGSEPVSTEVRFIASTTCDLGEAVRLGEFREDLYAAFGRCVLTVPALKDHREDIPLLVEHYVRRFCRRYRKQIEHVDPAMTARLASWDWPGNVRELSQVIERAVLLTTGRTLTADWHPLPAEAAGLGDADTDTLAYVERDHILQVLRRTSWVIEGPKGAARILGLHSSTLRSRMARLGIPRRSR